MCIYTFPLVHTGRAEHRWSTSGNHKERKNTGELQEVQVVGLIREGLTVGKSRADLTTLIISC